MALTQVAFGPFYTADGMTPIMTAADPTVTQSLAPTGSSQQTSIMSADTPVMMGCRVATDTAVYVSFGANPDAANDARRFLVTPGSDDFYCLVPPGVKAAVVTAA